MKLNANDSAGIRLYAASVVRQNSSRVLLAALLVVVVDFVVQLCLTLMGVTGSIDEPPLVTLLSNLVVLLVSAPLSYGLYELFQRMARRQPGSVKDMLLWFADGMKLKASVLGQLWLTLLTFCWLLLYVLPATFIGSMTGSVLLLSIIIFAAMLLGAAEVLLYTPGAYMLAEEPSRSVTECFSAARQGMKPYKWKFFGFYCLYILQLLAVVIPFALVIVFVPMSALMVSLVTLAGSSAAYLLIVPRMHMGCICYYHAVFGLEVAGPDAPFTM